MKRHWVETLPNGERKLVIVTEEEYTAHMEFKVQITNMKTNQRIIEATANKTGVTALLEQFTNLEQLGRAAFIRDLIDDGRSFYVAGPESDKRYALVVTKGDYDNGA